MSIRRFAVLLALSVAPSLSAQQDFSQVKVTVVPVGGAFVIDDEYAPLTDRIRAAIATVTPNPAEPF